MQTVCILLFDLNSFKTQIIMNQHLMKMKSAWEARKDFLALCLSIWVTFPICLE